MEEVMVVSEGLVKVSKIFEQLDTNCDGRLCLEDMAILVVASNPHLKFKGEQILTILDEAFESLGQRGHLIEDEKGGLSFDGLLQIYEGRFNEANRDFELLRHLAMGVDIYQGSNGNGQGEMDPINEDNNEETNSYISNTPMDTNIGLVLEHGIAYASTYLLIDDLVVILESLVEMNIINGKRRPTSEEIEGGTSYFLDLSSTDCLNRSVADVLNRHGDEEDAMGELEISHIQQRADALPSLDESFDAHMAIGYTLSIHYKLFSRAIVSFKKATILKPSHAHSHFLLGVSYFFVGECFKQARESFTMAIELAEMDLPQWEKLIPYIHLNLGVVLQKEGMVLNAREHFREACYKQTNHSQAWKLLGSSSLLLGEYSLAKWALEEAIKIKPNFVDAHCDLASSLHALGEHEQASLEYQIAIDLNPNCPHALFKLGELLIDIERYYRAVEIFSLVLKMDPNHWKAEVNRSIALLGVGDKAESMNSLNKANRMMSNQLGSYEVMIHMEEARKRRDKVEYKVGTSDVGLIDETNRGFIIVKPTNFRQANLTTTTSEWMALALDIRQLQKHTLLGSCEVLKLRGIIDSQPKNSSLGLEDNSIPKVELEKLIKGKLLHSVPPEGFQMAMKTINERILSVLAETRSGNIDLGMFFAIIAPICVGTLELRKKTAFEALLWRSSSNKVTLVDISLYLILLHAIYLSPQGERGLMLELHVEENEVGHIESITYLEFARRFHDHDWGFGIIELLLKLDMVEHVHHHKQTCSVCKNPIVGLRFKSQSQPNFSLCSLCYSKCKVPAFVSHTSSFAFKEYATERKTFMDKLFFLKSSKHK